jgi:hypothetical protein
MKCIEAQDLIMLYAEKRLNSIDTLRLRGHIEECIDCKEVFLFFDEATEEAKIEAESPNISENFVASIMENVNYLPSHKTKYEKKPVPLSAMLVHKLKTMLDNSSIGWLHIAGCLYAVLLSVGFVAMYETNQASTLFTNYTGYTILDNLNAYINLHISPVFLGFSSYLALPNFTQLGTVGLLDMLGNYLLVIGLFFMAALVFVVNRENRRTNTND